MEQKQKDRVILHCDCNSFFASVETVLNPAYAGVPMAVCGSEEERREADKYAACDLLIIDDLGTEMAGQFVTAALYSLMNDRLLENKPMVITTNLNVDEAARRYSPQIASRLYGSFTRLTFVGDDIRVMKNRGL